MKDSTILFNSYVEFNKQTKLPSKIYRFLAREQTDSSGVCMGWGEGEGEIWKAEEELRKEKKEELMDLDNSIVSDCVRA